MSSSRRTALVVGGFGALGSAVSAALADDGARVLRTSRASRPGAEDVVDLGAPGALTDLPLLDAVVWAHGVNANDSVGSHEDDELRSMLETNVELIAAQLRDLLAAERLAPHARVVVVSSIWELVARPGKFSYTVTKAAVGGLVRAAALDLAPLGVLVNGVLPGVVDTPMTRSMLSDEQIARFESATGSGRMIQPEDVASVVAYLASARNTGVTGQSIAVDLGFTVGRIL
ncbi:SDR family NAD(P)-dependent oxidoreductase [Cellulomonas soli]|uniref:Beta-ketoacyl-ACP reductase n=1 Tax=Cellulomonas soli TaxID=931535 RepID=A0A512P823_9CELL|nr:SDR family oxidoreductase [Cellulomonas soli]NYI57581.1 hypothetical protein [Cellulomonas soli]GEP67358.1 beta-ketoacyl-ACP reductase [Cellulomonas soli]